MRGERGADSRPACSAGRTGGPLRAVLVTHPPRLLHARTKAVLREFSAHLRVLLPTGSSALVSLAFASRRASRLVQRDTSFARKARLADERFRHPTRRRPHDRNGDKAIVGI